MWYSHLYNWIPSHILNNICAVYNFAYSLNLQNRTIRFSIRKSKRESITRICSDKTFISDKPSDLYADEGTKIHDAIKSLRESSQFMIICYQSECTGSKCTETTRLYPWILLLSYFAKSEVACNSKRVLERGKKGKREKDRWNYDVDQRERNKVLNWILATILSHWLS